jgi:hypothetical protein
MLYKKMHPVIEAPSRFDWPSDSGKLPASRHDSGSIRPEAGSQQLTTRFRTRTARHYIHLVLDAAAISHGGEAKPKPPGSSCHALKVNKDEIHAFPAHGRKCSTRSANDQHPKGQTFL